MSQQYNKIVKRRRRQAYNKRKQLTAKTKKAGASRRRRQDRREVATGNNGARAGVMVRSGNRMPPSAIQPRNFIEADIPFAIRLGQASGWNQTEADWRRFLKLEPEGCVVAEYEGQPAGTVTAVHYGKKLGWIGMMLVAPDRRRRGIASALLERVLRYLTEQEVETVKLDATPAGKAVYDQHGFQQEYLIERQLRLPSNFGNLCDDRHSKDKNLCRLILPGNVDRIAEFDAEIFGADRRRLLAALFRDAPDLCFQTDGGYVMGRRGATAAQIGPLVAMNTVVAAQLLFAVLRVLGDAPVLLDVPMSNEAANSLAAKFCFQKQRELIRQFRGPNRYPGDRQRIFGIAGPELG